MSLLTEVTEKATARGIPLALHMDITWRCNERCEHCYLDHDGKGEMSTDEIKGVLQELADTGTFFLSISGGEPLMRMDCFEILEFARALKFNVKLKTNAVMIGPKQAERIRKLGIEQVQISLYSHRPEVHDAITKLPGSLRRTIDGIKNLKAVGVKVSVTDVLMKYNHGDARAVKKLAEELGVNFVLDPTITPMLSGDRSILSLGSANVSLKS
jgi:AdoMet-dependent heme synthase